MTIGHRTSAKGNSALALFASAFAAMAVLAGSANAESLKRICCSASVPDGYIKVGDMWNPTDCGQPKDIVYNQCYIERYDNQPVGTTLEVCASAATPSGWSQVSTTWNPTKCGNPTQIVQNVMKIKRED